jgi:PhnB protein
MPRSTRPIPDGFSTLTSQLVVSDAPRLLDFLKAAFGATVLHVMHGPDGKSVMHGAVRVGQSAMFVSDAQGFAKPTSANVFVYVEDVDAAYQRAVKAGAEPVAPVGDMFWGDRWGMVVDPFGNHWQIATHVEDVPPAEMAARIKAMKPPT